MMQSSRRDFLRAAGVSAASVAAQRFLPAAHADDPAVTPPVRLGSGAHTYDCLHGWLTPPPHIVWGDTHGVAQDSAGRIYIAHTVHPSSPCSDAIVVFDKDGKFLASWGGRFRNGAHGLDIRREGRHEYLYHCDISDRLVVKTTLDGTVVWERGAPVEPKVYDEKHKFVPTNVALSPFGDGGFYVGDGYGSSFIHQFDKDANWVRTFGGPGKEAGQTSTPHGLFVDTRGSEPMLVVADRGNRRLQYFTLDGKHVRFVTEGMREPCHFDRRGDELLVPDLDSIVTILDKDDKVVAQLGDGFPSNLRGAPRSQFIPGKFIHPHSAKFLQNGDILVVEWVPIGRVTLLKRVEA